MKKENSVIKLIFLILCFNAGSLYAQNKPNENKSLESVLIDIVESVANRKQNKSTENDVQNDDSLMYDVDEEKKIKDAFEAFKNKIPLSENQENPAEAIPQDVYDAKSYVYLGSILYKSKNDWAIWINDKKISSQDNKTTNELYVKKIDEEKVGVVWTMSISKWKILTGNKLERNAPLNAHNQVEFNFVLSFNQTYVLNTNEVIEGKISPVTTSGSVDPKKTI